MWLLILTCSANNKKTGKQMAMRRQWQVVGLLANRQRYPRPKGWKTNHNPRHKIIMSQQQMWNTSGSMLTYCSFELVRVVGHVHQHGCISPHHKVAPRPQTIRRQYQPTWNSKDASEAKQQSEILLMEEILHQLICSWSHYLEGLQFIFQLVVWDFFHQQ